MLPVIFGLIPFRTNRNINRGNSIKQRQLNEELTKSKWNERTQNNRQQMNKTCAFFFCVSPLLLLLFFFVNACESIKCSNTDLKWQKRNRVLHTVFFIHFLKILFFSSIDYENAYKLNMDFTFDITFRSGRSK